MNKAEAIIKLDQIEGSSWAEKPWDALGLLSDTSYRSEYIVLPSVHRPRWVVPLGPRQVRARGMDLYAPASLAGRAQKAVLKFGLRWPALWKGRTISVSGKAQDGPLRPLLAKICGRQSYHFLLSVGTAGPGQKATILVMDERGLSTAIVKVEIGEQSRELILREAAALEQLARRRWPMTIPHLLGVEPTTFGMAMAQSVLSNVGRTRNRLTEGHWEILESLLGEDTVAIADYVSRRRLVERWTRIRDGFPNRISTIGKSLVDRLSDSNQLFQQCLVHGDFAPWNIGTIQGRGNNELAVYDWEYADFDGLPIIDAMHFSLQTGHLVQGLSPSLLWKRFLNLLQESAARKYLARARIEKKSQLNALAATYLLTAIVESHENGISLDTAIQKMRCTILELLNEDGIS